MLACCWFGRKERTPPLPTAAADPCFTEKRRGTESDEGGKTEKRELVTSTAAYRRTATADVPLLVFDVAAETLPPVIVV
nr:hypothetical protein Itr_chr07CG08800 [Ipomoea trifida]GLL31384.1 hypothetical protein Itr_chr07CG08810 [Ipomoea trifida]GLL46566.1 hypothetical protein Itr_chr14CG12600 [Ipomoea trifida]GLL46567.1 hypothetical protein Itr_chr14CG12610 [Ipomoea trifida]